MMQRSSCLERFEVSVGASVVSDVQGLDPKGKFLAIYRASEGERMYLWGF